LVESMVTPTQKAINTSERRSCGWGGADWQLIGNLFYHLFSLLSLKSGLAAWD